MSERSFGRIVVDGAPVELDTPSDLATALLRAGEIPSRGGALCLTGDCGNCLATVDGVAYVRLCMTQARPGTVVTRPPIAGKPPLPSVDQTVDGRPGIEAVQVERRHERRVVVGSSGAGRIGREAGHLLLSDSEGAEVVGIYPGPSIVARTRRGMLHVQADEVVVATGTVEIQLVCPGSDLAGIFTPRAAQIARTKGVDLGRTVLIGEPPRTWLEWPESGDLSAPPTEVGEIPGQRVKGDLVRFEGEAGWLSAVVTRNAAGVETRTSCDTAVVGLGSVARDVLARMSRDDAVTAVAAEEAPLPAPPTAPAAVVCPCMGTTVADLTTAFDRGYRDLELLKRASWAGLGPCQGGACLPHVRAFIAARTGVVPAPFTARPAARQITLAEAAADTTIDAFRRTPLHEEHLALGARMDRFGGWWRPWHYGDVIGEYWAVREAVSVGDVSTLGKVVVGGPDVVEALERIYPCRVADIKPGRSRYALLLNERGHVMDDGMILRDAETRFTLTFTSGGAANAEMWLRDWIDTWGLRVHVMDRTMSLAAINVTGPFAKALLKRAGLDDPPSFLGHLRAEIAGVPCHVMRLSFTGEAAFELHHPVDRSVELWRALLDLGRHLGARPHGLQALFGLRLEKGHVIVGMDTELDTTPRRLGMDWATRTDKPFFIGRAALERTAKLPDERRWFGFEMEGAAPAEGEPIRALVGDGVGGEVIGNVTGSWTSPLLRRALLLGWLRRGEPWPERVLIDGRFATRVATPFYDPEGLRARA